MTSATHTLVAELRARHGSFVLARVFLRLGREIPETFASIVEDKKMADDLRRACKELGLDT